MTEWALPANEAGTFHELMHDAVESGSPAARFLRGGLWRNFQARYREINDLHKQMLRVSAAVDAMPAGAARGRALDHLYRGQSNDCYWHGLFGGIYIVHMRMATLAELIAAEDLAGAGAALSGVADYDLDGVAEVLLGTVGQTVLVDVAEGAGIGAWDLRASRVALGAVMRRRFEAYHVQLRAMEEAQARSQKSDTKTLTSIHDELLAKEAGLSALLVYDDHERRSGLARVLDRDGHDVGDFARAAWAVEQVADRQLVVGRRADGLALRKTITLAGGRPDPTLSLSVEVVNDGGQLFTGILELEWNLNLLGGGGNPAAYYRGAGEEARHDGRGSVRAGAPLSFGNTHEGVNVALDAQPPAGQAWFPIATVSNSEAGFERVYQGSCLTQRWPLHLAPGDATTFSTTFRVTQSRDRADEDGG